MQINSTLNCTENDGKESDSMNLEVSSKTAEEIRKALKEISRGKAGAEEGLTVSLIKRCSQLCTLQIILNRYQMQTGAHST